MTSPTAASPTRMAECAMACAALVLAFNGLLLARSLVGAAPDGAFAAEPAPRAAVPGHAGAQSPWDEDLTMGRHPEQNPFHVPGET